MKPAVSHLLQAYCTQTKNVRLVDVHAMRATLYEQKRQCAGKANMNNDFALLGLRCVATETDIAQYSDKVFRSLNVAVCVKLFLCLCHGVTVDKRCRRHCVIGSVSECVRA